MNKILVAASLFAVAVASASCSKDDKTFDPADAVTLNMSNENNGKTMLEDAIYIDDSNNFVATDDCTIMSVGKVGGLGGVEFASIGHTASQVAVQSGYGYAVFHTASLMQFPSGKYALRAGSTSADYLKIYVVSALKKKDEVVGASVKYTVVIPKRYGLPEFGSEVVKVGAYADNSASLTLSTSDFEYDFNVADGRFKVRKDGAKLIFSPAESTYLYSGSYPLYIRIRESYTKVYVVVE